MDRLEEFIKKNKDQFDQAEAPDFNWDQIKTPKKKETKVRRLPMLALAASLSLLIGIFFFATRTQTNQSSFAQTELGEELPELKAYYSSQVANKFEELKRYNADPDVENDMKQMDSFLQELEEELKDVPASKRDEVIEAMIQNYQYKLLMLDRVLDKIKKTDKEDNDDTINI